MCSHVFRVKLLNAKSMYFPKVLLLAHFFSVLYFRRQSMAVFYPILFERKNMCMWLKFIDWNQSYAWNSRWTRRMDTRKNSASKRLALSNSKHKRKWYKPICRYFTKWMRINFKTSRTDRKSLLKTKAKKIN